MTAAATSLHSSQVSNVPVLFAVTVFTSAALVFLVEPMVAKMLLPSLGGSPSVWNTSLAFFQVALLLGYGYAHLLQRLRRVQHQVIVHMALLLLAVLTLPLRISAVLGAPNPSTPILWVLGELTLSVGAPFALLSATAPLVQAWFVKTAPLDPVTQKTPEPYALYAASNFGSLLALVAYPVVIEPFLTLSAQRWGWSLIFVAFMALISTLGFLQSRHAREDSPAHTEAKITSRPSWREMTLWVLLAAAPSSLMMGVTTHLTTDVASAPFLWVVPLALYLVTFILAFQTHPIIRPKITIALQAVTVAACIFIMPFTGASIVSKLAINLSAFFMTALMCHQLLASRRPDPQHLTLFYLCMSLGGVIGGSFNAFLAPVIFSSVTEYPLVLILTCLARPWGQGQRNGYKLNLREALMVAFGLLACVLVICLAQSSTSEVAGLYQMIIKGALLLVIILAVLIRERGLYFAVLMAALSISGDIAGEHDNIIKIDRSFFGVTKISEVNDPGMGQVRQMAHGTTLHGAQALSPELACHPLTYYAPETGIGQTVTHMQAVHPALNMAVVGLGTGALAGYVRPTDHLTYYEIDPLVVRYARDPKYFTYISGCAKGPVDFSVGDARLNLTPVTPGKYDLLIIDAFSSDTVPAHLLTVEATKMYLSKLSPNGILLFHLSNRHLELRDPVMAAIRQAGAQALTQTHLVKTTNSVMASSTIVVIAARTPEAMAAFKADASWQDHSPNLVRPWTDDYTNLIGALLAHRTPK